MLVIWNDFLQLLARGQSVVEFLSYFQLRKWWHLQGIQEVHWLGVTVKSLTIFREPMKFYTREAKSILEKLTFGSVWESISSLNRQLFTVLISNQD